MATMADWARPACGLYSWTVGWTEMAEMMRRTRRLTVMAAWFMAQPLLAKKMYITMVMAKDMVYIPRVDPMRILLQAFES